MTGFSIAHDATFSRKVAHFAAAGPHKLHFVFDFDRTLTVARLRVYDPRSDEDPAQVRQKTFTRFDAMLESGDFAPLLALLRRLLG